MSIFTPDPTPELTQSRPASTVAGMLGDWLLSFPTAPTGLPVRLPAAPWGYERAGGQLRHTSMAEGWRGAPLLVVESPDWTAWLVGELYDAPHPADAVVAVLNGRAGADTLNGHFLLMAWNRPADEWHIWTNRHATLHAYYATNGERTAIGTFLPAVAAATGRSELDWEGLASFFGFGFFAADRTHLVGVRILRPATHYHLDGRGRLLSKQRYWSWRHAPDNSRSYDETLEEFAALFTTVMGGLTAEGRIAVPISGGLDSRSTVATMTAGSLAPNGPATGRLWAYSYGYSRDSVETDIARRVAAARGLDFDAFTIRPYLFERLPGIIAATEGFEDVTQCRQAAVVDDIAGHADFLIAAHWGDVYLDDSGVGHLPQPVDGLSGLVMKKFSKAGSDWLLDNLCRPRLDLDDPRAMLRDLVEGELEYFEHIEDPDFRFKALKTDQWSARWTTVALRMFQAAAFPRLPFYDTRLVDFFCNVPTAYVAGRRLQIDYLRHYAPDLARIPWQATGRDLFHSGREGTWDSARRAALKGRRQLSGRKIVERNWEVQFLGHEGRSGLAHWLMRPGLALHEFVAPRAVGELLDAFGRDPYVDKRNYTVAMLLTFSAWLELQTGGAA